jgi:hypothetical protein
MFEREIRGDAGTLGEILDLRDAHAPSGAPRRGVALPCRSAAGFASGDSHASVNNWEEAA